MVSTSSRVASAHVLMSTSSITKPRLPVRTLAADQRLAKLPRLSKAAAKRIIQRGHDRILASTHSEEIAKEYQQKMESILAESASW